MWSVTASLGWPHRCLSSTITRLCGRRRWYSAIVHFERLIFERQEHACLLHDLPDDPPSHIERCKGALTAPALATLLGMSRTTIYEMAATNRLPYYRIGCMVRFDPVTIAEWLRSQSVHLAP